MDYWSRIGLIPGWEYPHATTPDLNATIRIVPGCELIADNHESDYAMCQQFERWVQEHYPATAQ